MRVFADESKNFNVEIALEKNWRKVKSITSYYEVVETVIDRRGTSNSTHVEKVYVSENQQSNRVYKSTKLKLNYPDIDLPGTMEHEDMSLKWRAIVVLEMNFGFSCKFERYFSVEKKY